MPARRWGAHGLRPARPNIKLTSLDELPIPRVFHRLWLGPAPLPEDHRRWIDGWAHHHPGWSARLWTDADLPRLVNRAGFDQATTWAQRADIARYEILLRHGGVYLDTDVECLRNIEALMAGVSAFAGWEREGLIGNAVLGATADHPWMQELVAELPAAMASSWLTIEQTGPAFLTRITATRADVKLLDPVVFYPVPSDSTAAVDPPEEAFAVHHFAKSWSLSERRRLGELFGRMVTELVPAGRTLILVADWVEVSPLADRRTLAFLERDGLDWGPPADDREAEAALDRHRRAGVDVVVFLQPAWWWLEHYTGLAARLRELACAVHESEYLIAFWLRPPPG